MIAPVLCLLVPALPGCTSVVDYMATPQRIAAARSYYDGKNVYVTGIVRRKNAKYFVCAERGCIRVVVPAQEPLRAGQMASVRGPYLRRSDAIRATEVLARG